MKTRKTIAIIFMCIALVFSVIFYLDINYPENIGGYFKKTYYSQYGPMAICIELLGGGFYLFKGSTKANFALALFGFTTVMDILFHITSLIPSNTPLHAILVFSACAVGAFHIAFSNAFHLGKITYLTSYHCKFCNGQYH